MLGFIGGGLMAEPTSKELVDLGVKSSEAKDYIQAKKYFEKACDLKDGRGCGSLGDLYENDQGVEKDLIKAAYFYSKACDLKEGMGCGALGGLYYNGDGVKRDSKKADQYFSKACKLGDQEACEALKEK
ncbi:hypothetical protein HpBGD82_03970 [Helicobacter pylori]